LKALWRPRWTVVKAVSNWSRWRRRRCHHERDHTIHRRR
jgi:hypothetical protein